MSTPEQVLMLTVEIGSLMEEVRACGRGVGDATKLQDVYDEIAELQHQRRLLIENHQHHTGEIIDNDGREVAGW